MYWHVGVIFSQRMEFIIGTPLIARYSPRSPHLLTLEIARRLEGKTALGRGEPVGGPALPFFVPSGLLMNDAKVFHHVLGVAQMVLEYLQTAL